MNFEAGQIYHIYNQGNNRQQIFFSRDNQLYFLKKLRAYILPYADILAWCLMPNHFHLMVYVRTVSIDGVTSSHPVSNSSGTIDRETSSHPVSNSSGTIDRETSSHPVNNTNRSFNDSIAIMLRSYTRAIHKQRDTSGALFREATKAECISKTDEGITPSFYNTKYGTSLNLHPMERSYPKICFDYIHQNPVAAGLCHKPEEWEFSSFIDYIGKREGTLIHYSKAFELGLTF